MTLELPNEPCEVGRNVRWNCGGFAVFECGACSRRVCKRHGRVRLEFCNSCARLDAQRAAYTRRIEELLGA